MFVAWTDPPSATARVGLGGRSELGRQQPAKCWALGTQVSAGWQRSKELRDLRAPPQTEENPLNLPIQRYTDGVQ
jgi:hypothetical protein